MWCSVAVTSNSLQSQGLQHTRLLRHLSPRVCSNSCALRQPSITFDKIWYDSNQNIRIQVSFCLLNRRFKIVRGILKRWRRGQTFMYSEHQTCVCVILCREEKRNKKERRREGRMEEGKGRKEDGKRRKNERKKAKEIKREEQERGANVISVQCNIEFMHCMNKIITVKMKTVIHDGNNDKILFFIIWLSIRLN